MSKPRRACATRAAWGGPGCLFGLFVGVVAVAGPAVAFAGEGLGRCGAQGRVLLQTGEGGAGGVEPGACGGDVVLEFAQCPDGVGGAGCGAAAYQQLVVVAGGLVAGGVGLPYDAAGVLEGGVGGGVFGVQLGGALVGVAVEGFGVRGPVVRRSAKRVTASGLVGMAGR